MSDRWNHLAFIKHVPPTVTSPLPIHHSDDHIHLSYSTTDHGHTTSPICFANMERWPKMEGVGYGLAFRCPNKLPLNCYYSFPPTLDRFNWSSLCKYGWLSKFLHHKWEEWTRCIHPVVQLTTRKASFCLWFELPMDVASEPNLCRKDIWICNCFHTEMLDYI